MTKLKQQAQREIESSAKAAVQELREFAAQQSVALAEVSIRRDLRTEDDRRIIGLNVEQLGGAPMSSQTVARRYAAALADVYWREDLHEEYRMN